MKKLIFILSFLFLGFGATFAQSSNGGGQGNNGQGQVPNHQQSGMSMGLITKILKAATPHFNQTQGLNHGQLIQKYNKCECQVIWVEGDTYIVIVGGNDFIVIEASSL